MNQPPGGGPVRIGDLGVLMIGLAVVFAAARRSRLVFSGGELDLPLTLGLLALTLGVGLVLVLTGRLARLWRGKARRPWPIAWRVAALLGLVGLLTELSRALAADDPVTPTAAIGLPDRRRLATLLTMLGLVGVLLAATPLPARAGRLRPRGSATLAVVGAVAAGLLMLACWHGVVPYLVLLQIEAERLAQAAGPPGRRPMLFDRLTTAALEALLGLLACLVAAIGVVGDLRRAGADPLGSRAPRTRAGVVGRALIVALAAGGAAHVAGFGLAAVSRPLAEGIAEVGPPLLLAAIGVGYALLAAGLAARGAGHLAAAVLPTGPPEPTPRRPFGRWPRRVGGCATGLAAGLLLLAAVEHLAGNHEGRWYVPVSLQGWGDLGDAPLRRLGVRWLLDWHDLVASPDIPLVIGLTPWLAVGLARLAWARQPARPAALDLVGADRLALGRFLGWWGTLTVAITASLPGLVAIALGLLDRVVR